MWCTQDSCCESDVVTTLLLIHASQSLPWLFVRYNWVSLTWSQPYHLKPDALKPAMSPVFCSIPCRQTDKLKPPKQWVKYTGTFLAMSQTSSASPLIQVSSSPLYSKYCMIYVLSSPWAWFRDSWASRTMSQMQGGRTILKSNFAKDKIFTISNQN